MRFNYTTHVLKLSRPIVAWTTIIIVLGIFPMNTYALSCAANTYTLEEAYAAADSIIIGLVTGCKEEVSSEPWANGGSGCSFDSLEVLKESKSARDHRGVVSSSACGLSVQVGNQYLLFLDGENRPMRFSGSLDGDQFATQRSTSYERILREFRDGVIRDLSEPWVVREYEGTCFLSHGVGEHQITLRRQKADAPDPFTQDWTREIVDGKTIYRSIASSAGTNTASLSPDMEIVMSGNLPDYPVGTQILSISFPERPPVPIRDATISVDTQSWSLYRMELSISHRGMPADTRTEYLVTGEVSEQILSAMTRPSDVIVSAVLVNSSTVDSESPPTTSLFDQGSVTQLQPDDDYFSQAPATTSSVRPAVVPSDRKARSYRSRKEPPEPVLRLETRTTQLPAVVENFRACYGGD